jgi:hypothetical protein
MRWAQFGLDKKCPVRPLESTRYLAEEEGFDETSGRTESAERCAVSRFRVSRMAGDADGIVFHNPAVDFVALISHNAT